MDYSLSKEAYQSKFLTKVYGWMVIALAISGVSAWLGAVDIAHRGMLYNLLIANRVGYIVLAVAELVLVFVLSLAIQRISAFTASVLFVVYSIVNGLTLSVIFLIYTKESIFSIFLVSAVMFGAMALYGTVTKSNLMGFGKYFMMALIGVAVASLLNIFFNSSVFSTMISIVAVVLFTGLTAYDAQKLQRMAETSYRASSEAIGKVAVIGALELYLDFINIFLHLLQLFGKRSD